VRLELLLQRAARAALSKKASDVVILDVRRQALSPTTS
jgi:ribosomal silencing factor RsfS